MQGAIQVLCFTFFYQLLQQSVSVESVCYNVVVDLDGLQQQQQQQFVIYLFKLLISFTMCFFLLPW